MNDPTRPVSVYLDHAATTPMLPEAVEAMTAQLADDRQRARLHASGRRRPPGRGGVAGDASPQASAPARARWSSPPAAPRPTTSRVKGLFWARRDADPRRRRILTTAVEHHAVLDPLHWLAEHEGAEVELLPVDHARPPRRRRAARARSSATPARSRWSRSCGPTTRSAPSSRSRASSRSPHAHGIPVHTDAVQAVGAVPVDFAACGVDALTLTAHKVGGPYGVGALVVRRELELTAAAARRRPGARHPLRHPRRPGDRRASPPPSSSP